MRDGAIIVVFPSFFVGFMLLLSCAAWAQPPVLPLSVPQPRIELTERMESVRLPAGGADEPDRLWVADAGAAVAPAPRWWLKAGERMVGRITLAGPAAGATYVVHVPVSLVDEVQIWHREGGGDWTSARAGDRISLSQWPFAGQFPAFPIQVGAVPVDLIVSATNDGLLQIPVLLLPDADFREDGGRRANLAGMVMGLGVMVTVVCLLGALTLRRRAAWLLALVAAWTLLAITCANGYMAVWFTPDLPAFNDASKHIVAMMLAGWVLALTAESLDLRYLLRAERWAAWAAPLVGVAYVTVQALWLPPPWRVPGAALWVLSTMGFSIALCALNRTRGGRHTGPVMAAVGCLLAAMLLPFLPPDLVAGLDLRAAGLAMLLYAALLLFRHAHIARERYGRDVLGRAAVSANRDPLTALLSYSGFEFAYDEALLRQGAGAGASSAMLFLLPGLERSGTEHGFVVTERALVRFSAALQGALGDAWSIARLSKTRFACISTQPQGDRQLAAQATRVLARCARLTQAPAPVADFGLRIACVRRRLGGESLRVLLQELEEAALALGEGKRITSI
jgi:GGDEF domain-containing protein